MSITSWCAVASYISFVISSSQSFSYTLLLQKLIIVWSRLCFCRLLRSISDSLILFISLSISLHIYLSIYQSLYTSLSLPLSICSSSSFFPSHLPFTIRIFSIQQSLINYLNFLFSLIEVKNQLYRLWILPIQSLFLEILLLKKCIFTMDYKIKIL